MSIDYSPPDKEELRDEYNLKYPFYKKLLDEIEFCLDDILKEKSIRISGIESRNSKPKDFDSFYDKIVRKKIEDNFFEKIEDIAGIRVICLYRSDLEKIESTIKEKLRVLKAELVRDTEELTFGYMSDHYIVKFPLEYSGPRYDTIKNLKCEIQVRTVSMHAWATVSHHLDYKQKIDVPSELKKDFSALSGVFYIADSLFEQFKIARDLSINVMLESIKQDKFDLTMEINFDSLNAYILWRFPKRFELEDGDYPFELRSILNEIRYTKVTKLNELNDLVDKHWDAFLEEDKEHAERESRDIFFTSIGSIRCILDYEYPDLAEKSRERARQKSELEYYDDPDYEEPDHEEPDYEEPDHEEPDYEGI